MDAEFIDLTPENIEDEHLCCIIRTKKGPPGIEAKRAWLKERLGEGHVFRKLNVKGCAFIEYAPLETAWVPVLGENFYYIYCLWVHGAPKGHGYGRQLMEYCMGLPEVETVSDALYMVLHRIEGAYALGILCSDDPDHVYAARKDAPLLIGFGKGENFIASDVTALVKYTRDVVYMEDGEVAVLGRDGVQVYNAMELPIEKEHHHIDWEISAAEKGGYEHFMIKGVAMVMKLKQMRRQLAVRFCPNGKAGLFQHFPQLHIVFDDAVVHQSDASVFAHMRVGVDVRRFSVGGPAGMADAERAGQKRAVFGFCDQILEPSLGLFDLQNAVLLHADACGVIAPVFQARQTLQQDGRSLLGSYVSYDTTHMKLFLL